MRCTAVAVTLTLVALAGVRVPHAQGVERGSGAGRGSYAARELRAGTRVRATVWRTEPGRQSDFAHLAGRLVRLDEDSLLVPVSDGRVVAVPRRDVSRLEVPGGGSSRGHAALRGARNGALVGAFAGIALGYFGTDACATDPTCVPRGEAAFIGGVALGTLGLAVGGVVGMASGGGERRRPVLLDGDARIGIAIVPLGAGLALRF